MKFRYKAYNEKMERIAGIVEGLSIEEAKSKLREENWKIISIDSAEKSSKILIPRRYNAKDLSVLFSQLALLINHGIDLVDGIEFIKYETKGWKKKALDQMHSLLVEGKMLSYAVKETKVFPPLVFGMLQSAEVSGELGFTFQSLAQYYKKEEEIKKKIVNAISYPILLLITSIVVSQIILEYVLPVFADTLGEISALPLGTRFLIFISTHFQEYGMFYRIFLLLFLVLFYFFYKKPESRRKMDRFFYHFPILGSFYRKQFQLNFFRSLEIQMKTGVPLLQIMGNTRHLTENFYLKELFEKVIYDLEKGKPFVESLYQNDILEKREYALLHTGEKTSQFLPMLGISIELLEEEMDQFIGKLGVYLEPILIIIMALIVGFIVFSIAIPMFDMVNTL